MTNDPKSEDQPAGAPATDANLDATIRELLVSAPGQLRPAHADPVVDHRLPLARNLLSAVPDPATASLGVEPGRLTGVVAPVEANREQPKEESRPALRAGVALATAATAVTVERSGWFRKRTPEPAPKLEPVLEPEVSAGAAAPPAAMVDLGPVREAMQAAALRRDEGPVDEIPTPAEDAARVGVLLVNLGTPEKPTARAIRRYLRQFLADRRVIEKDTFAWQMVLKGIILPFRPRIKARAYRAIWNKQNNESPLKTVTRAQAEKLGETLAKAGSDALVDWAMRYGNPSMESCIRGLVAQGCTRIMLLPLYPQYSSATTASVCDEAFRVLTRLRHQPSLRVAAPYYADPTYIEALASSIRHELARLPFQPDVILASFHGMPLEYVQKGDPYHRQCTRTTDLLRERLGLHETNFMMTFQSRFGRTEWLQPYTDQTLRKLAKDGVKNVAVVTPGFSADCLETLEEIAIENAHIFKKKGGKNFAFIPCLNDSELGMAVIREIAARELNGWV